MLGQEQLLCPSCLQVPHQCLRFGGGSIASSAGGCVGRGGVPGALPGLGTSGKRQVVSLSLSGQNGRMLSYRYHRLSAERPFGVTIKGKSFRSGDHRGDFIRSNFSSSVSACSWTNTAPSWKESHRKWWYFLYQSLS